MFGSLLFVDVGCLKVVGFVCYFEMYYSVFVLICDGCVVVVGVWVGVGGGVFDVMVVGSVVGIFVVDGDVVVVFDVDGVFMYYSVLVEVVCFVVVLVVVFVVVFVVVLVDFFDVDVDVLVVVVFVVLVCVVMFVVVVLCCVCVLNGLSWKINVCVGCVMMVYGNCSFYDISMCLVDVLVKIVGMCFMLLNCM